MDATITVENIGSSVGVKMDPVILSQLTLEHNDQIKITIIDILQGSDKLKELLENAERPLALYGKLIKAGGNTLGMTIKKKRLEDYGIELGNVFNVDIDKIS